MFLLNDRVIIFLLIGLNLTQSQNLIPWILSSDGLDFPFVHVINHNHFFLHQINSNLGDLFFGLLLWTLFKLPRHFLNTNLPDMIIIIEVIFGRIDFISFRLDKRNTLCDQSIVSVDIQFDSLFTYFLNSLDQSVRVSVRIVVDNSHPSVDFGDFLPVRHFARTIILNCFELKRITVFAL